MTRDKILKMAQKARDSIPYHARIGSVRSMADAHLEHFARAVYAKAIEDAAKECEDLSYLEGAFVANEFASAIRALGKEQPAGKGKP